MLKLKYFTLNKEEKLKLKKDFYQTDFGKDIKIRLTRLLITGILGIIFSIFLFIYHTTKWDIITGIILDIASLFFIIGSFKIRIDKLNDYLIKKSKK